MPQPSAAPGLLATLVPATLAMVSLVFYAGEVVLLTFHAVPPANRDIVAGAVGFIGGSLVGASFGFYFGASMHLKAPEPAGSPPGAAAP
jgi:hypothetical protein